MNRTIKKLGVCFFLPVLLAFTVLAGCGSPKLATPTGLNVDEAELTLMWNEVTDAAFYTIRIEGDGETTEADSGKNYYSFERLSAGTYTFRVKAVSGSNESYSDSAWSDPITYDREAENGLTYKLIDSSTAYEVSGIGTAEGDVVVPDVYRSKPVTKIGDGAFYNKNSLTSIVLGKNITEIGEQAFANCSMLTNVTLPEGLKTIGAKAFQSCRLLETDLVIPDSVTQIGAQAFEYCRKITKVTLGKGLTVIPENAFNGCSALAAVTIPDNVTTLEEGAFSACSALKSVEMGSGLTAIGTDAFRKCVALTAVTLGENVESLGDYAFAECTELVSAQLGDKLKTIGVQAFYGCSKLADVKLGSGLEKISKEAFKMTALWSTTQTNYLDGWLLGTDSETAPDIEEGTIGIADYAFANCKNFNNLITIPDSVKYIGEAAFKDGSTVNNVIIGKGVVSIGDSAFEKSGLSFIVLGARDDEAEDMLGESSLRYIGANAFKECATLTEISIPDTVENIGMSAFENSGIWTNADRVVYAGNWIVGYKDDESVGSVSVTDGTAGIAEYAFSFQEGITGVTMPDSVKYIGKSAFYECKKMTFVTLPANLTEINDYTFYRCENLNLPELPEGITRIGRSAFYMCALGTATSDTDSDQLVIPDSVTEIGDYAFYKSGYTYEDPDATEESGELIKNGGIDAVVIGDGVKTIGYQAFANIPTLKSVVMGDALETVGERAFYKCAALQEVSFGKNVKTIGERAFYSCTSLKAAEMPASVESIGSYAFYKCSSLAEVNLGSAEEIGDYAFYGCSALASLSIPSTVKTIGKQAFRNCSALTSVFIGANVQFIGAHAFYGCNSLTVYAESDAQPDGWNTRWNTSYRPVVWGSDADQSGYLVSVTITEAGITNLNFSYKLSAPVREGFVFGGWAETPGGAAVYQLDEISSAAVGTTLYAVWTAE